MRLRACMGLLLLGVGACAYIPDHIRIETDAGTVEVSKKPSAEPEGDDERR